MDFINKGSIFSLKEALQLLSNRSKGINSISAVQKGRKKREGVVRWPSDASFPPQSSVTPPAALTQRAQRQRENGHAGSSCELKRLDYGCESKLYQDTGTLFFIKKDFGRRRI